MGLKRSSPEKIREWRERSKQLERGAPPKRRTWMKKVNPERAAQKYKDNFGARADRIREMTCLVGDKMAQVYASGRAIPDDWMPCVGHAVPAHARARGMGGAKGDRRDLCRLCWNHHEEAGEYRTSQRGVFELKYGVDLIAEAEAQAKIFDDMGLP